MTAAWSGINLYRLTKLLNRLGIPHEVVSGESFAANPNPRATYSVSADCYAAQRVSWFTSGLVARRGDLRDAPILQYRDKIILLYTAHADPQTGAGTRAKRQRWLRRINRLYSRAALEQTRTTAPTWWINLEMPSFFFLLITFHERWTLKLMPHNFWMRQTNRRIWKTYPPKE